MASGLFWWFYLNIFKKHPKPSIILKFNQIWTFSLFEIRKASGFPSLASPFSIFKKFCQFSNGHHRLQFGHFDHPISHAWSTELGQFYVKRFRRFGAHLGVKKSIFVKLGSCSSLLKSSKLNSIQKERSRADAIIQMHPPPPPPITF